MPQCSAPAPKSQGEVRAQGRAKVELRWGLSRGTPQQRHRGRHHRSRWGWARRSCGQLEHPGFVLGCCRDCGGQVGLVASWEQGGQWRDGRRLEGHWTWLLRAPQSEGSRFLVDWGRRDPAGVEARGEEDTGRASASLPRLPAPRFLLLHVLTGHLWWDRPAWT